MFGNDSMAANLIYQMNKVRYKDGKGDPKGFVIFLDRNNLSRGLLPRYRGNRLHVLFHIAGIMIEHHDKLTEFLKSGTSLGGLRYSVLKDFSNEIAKGELQVLGLIGKYLTSAWMIMCYT